MRRYRKKPVVVEAFQFEPTVPYPHMVTGLWFDPVGRPHYGVEGDPKMVPWVDFTPVIRTLEGDIAVYEGDWIIKGIRGEFYPCNPDIFEETYEPVENDDE